MNQVKHTAYDIISSKGHNLGQVSACSPSKARLMALEMAQQHSILECRPVKLRNRSTSVTVIVDRDQITPTP